MNICFHFKADLCRKRQKQCHFCELSLDFDQFENHVDFCGSRTEPCPLCNRYIQIRDYNRHEDSNCAYPEVKVATLAAPRPRPGRVPAAVALASFGGAQSSMSQRGDSARSLDKNYLNQFVRESSRMSLSMLPCEFCGESYSSSELLKHQVAFLMF